ncbi:hypothetical protein NC652_035051 [Populus alba x Populus x berolinensis]|nr:hypothetical protein NC652_035051 [Populus alba x Populus x berolinensis]
MSPSESEIPGRHRLEDGGNQSSDLQCYEHSKNMISKSRKYNLMITQIPFHLEHEILIDLCVKAYHIASNVVQ